MPPRDEENNTRILIQIAGDIGRTREATETLKDNYATLTEDVKEIKEQLGKTVTTPECVEKHRQVSRTMEVVKTDIIAEIKKSGTGVAHPAITSEMLKAASAPTVQEMATALEEKAEEKKEKRRKMLAVWVGIITGVVGLFSGGAWGVYKVAVYATKLETLVSTGNQEVQSEIRKNKNSKVVVVKFPPLPTKNDDAVEPPEPPEPTPAPLTPIAPRTTPRAKKSPRVHP
jgi:hypothetical protein